jgi:hypothetical protein
MSIQCQTITVLKPANIVATDMTMSKNDCEEPCDVTVTITWQNIGSKPGTITPGIIVNDVTTNGTPITLAKDETVTQTFNLTNLPEIAGDYTICPYPN